VSTYKNDPSVLFTGDDLISQAEAARMRSTTRQAISKLVQQGRLTTYSVGGHPFVSREEVANFQPGTKGRKSTKGNDAKPKN